MTESLSIIHASIAAIRLENDVPSARLLVTGEINMAEKLGLIDEAMKQELIRILLLACQHRRTQLHRARMDGLKQ